MANCQNNMRYGRQMNPRSGCSAMPANINNACRNTPASNNNACRNTPVNNNNTCQNTPVNNKCNAMPKPLCEQPARDRAPQNNCGCRAPEPQKKECQAPPRRQVDNRTTDCPLQNKKQVEPCRCRYDALEDFPLAMAYVPWQKWQNVFEPCKGLQCGTIFEELVKPFHGKGGCNR